MLFCDQTFSPTEISREIRQIPQSSTNPIEVMTDHGICFIKCAQSPMGKDPLVNEYVASEIGCWLGLKIPPFSILTNSPLKLTLKKNAADISGPYFCSKKVDASTFDGSDLYLNRLKCQQDIAMLVLFDTWLRNWDRYFESEQNLDNLLFGWRAKSPKLDLIPIDHSECLRSPGAPCWDMEEEICDEAVYGNFPAFEPYLSISSVRAAVSKLRSLDPGHVSEIVAAIPGAWLDSSSERDQIHNFLVKRAQYVVDTFEDHILGEPPLPGM